MPFPSRRQAACLLTFAIAACTGAPVEPERAGAPAATVQERQCLARGWQREQVRSAALDRRVLWKAPPGGWPRGALVVMHGGGGSYTNFCVANVALIEPQVDFTDAALAAGFAVFLLDSTDRVTDDAGRLCGKVWDDEVRERANLDLPFIGDVLGALIPARRPAGSRGEIFLVGHSSGGYMSARAATHLPDRVSGFALVASGDPYGWYRDCTRRATDRPNVFGAGFDRETRRMIVEPFACRAVSYPNERPWDGASATARPPFRLFHHENDAINDVSCAEKIDAQLRVRGYPGAAPLRLTGGSRALAWHFWLKSYNAPLVDFFGSLAR
jgi:poly(3-hydroxybutyrate) depolymerase